MSDVFLLWCVLEVSFSLACIADYLTEAKMMVPLRNRHQHLYSYLFPVNGKFLFFSKQASTARQQFYNNAVVKVNHSIMIRNCFLCQPCTFLMLADQLRQFICP